MYGNRAPKGSVLTLFGCLDFDEFASLNAVKLTSFPCPDHGFCFIHAAGLSP